MVKVLSIANISVKRIKTKGFKFKISPEMMDDHPTFYERLKKSIIAYFSLPS